MGGGAGSAGRVVVAMGVAWAGSGVGVVGVKFVTKKTPKG